MNTNKLLRLRQYLVIVPLLIMLIPYGLMTIIVSTLLWLGNDETFKDTFRSM